MKSLSRLEVFLVVLLSWIGLCMSVVNVKTGTTSMMRSKFLMSNRGGEVSSPSKAYDPQKVTLRVQYCGG